MIRTLVIVGVGAALLLVAVVIARPSEREGVPGALKRSGPRDEGPTGPSIPSESLERPGKEAERPALPSLSSEPPEEIGERPGRPTGDPFWDDVEALLAARLSTDPAKHREAVLARTAAYLGLEGQVRTTFSEMASSVADEIGRAWEVREHLFLTLPPDREEEEQAIQQAYEESKRNALGRLEAVLRDSAGHQELRARLEEWIDAVR